MTRRRRMVFLILAGAIGSASPGPTFAAGNAFATLEAAGGQVVVIRAGQSLPPAPGTPLELNDIVVTRRGRATVRFSSDGTVLRVGPDSRVQVNETAGERDVTVFFGRLWAHVVRWKERPTRFTTSGTIAAVRGTELSLAVESDGESTRLAVLEGRVLAKNDAGSLELTGGQSATARKGTAPVRSIAVRPKDAVQWALYYLPVLSIRPGELGQGAPWQAKVEESAGAWSKGDLDRALTSLEGLPVAEIRDPRFFTYRASLLLAAGSVEEAGKDLDQALKLAENDSDALALQSIVAVARNENDKALSLARRSVSADPKSSSAQIALSYAQQAAFDLEGARASLEKAVALEPDDALAWARLAEIRSSLGNLDGALEAARKATELAPNLARTQSVLGFAHLTRVRTAEAKAAFARAIELDSSDPLPRLGPRAGPHPGRQAGRGQQGDRDRGEPRPRPVAPAQLPGQGLLRGQARGPRGPRVRARQAGGPQGPDALPLRRDRQADHQPAGGGAGELPGGDRAQRQPRRLPLAPAARLRRGRPQRQPRPRVLRPRLPGSRARRGLELGQHRPHQLLGPPLPGRLLRRPAPARDRQGQRAAAVPAPPAAQHHPHPAPARREQPARHLAGGPGVLSFNEFNPLFNRNGVTFQGTGLAGENGLWTGDGVVAGIYEKLSFSAGYSQFETDGWRENAFQKDKIGNAFLQLALSPDTSIQAEYRYRDKQYGDLQQKFFTDLFLPGETHDVQRETFRLGGRHTFSPRSVLLVNATYANTDDLVTIDGFFGPDSSLSSKLAQEAYGAEAQHLFRSRFVDVTSGLGYFNIDGETLQAFSFGPGIVEEAPPIPGAYDHFNAYAYANLKPHATVTLTAGGSYDQVEGDLAEDERDQFNPKVGLDLGAAPDDDRAGGRVQEPQADPDHRPDPGADPGRRLQPVLRRRRPDRGLEVRRRDRPGVRQARPRRIRVLGARPHRPPVRPRRDGGEGGLEGEADPGLPVRDTAPLGGPARAVPPRALRAARGPRRGVPRAADGSSASGRAASSTRRESPPPSPRPGGTRRASSRASSTPPPPRRRAARSSGWSTRASAIACRSGTGS